MGFGMLLRNAIALMYTAAYGGFMYAVEIVEGLCMRVLWVRALGVRGLLELLHVILLPCGVQGSKHPIVIHTPVQNLCYNCYCPNPKYAVIIRYLDP